MKQFAITVGAGVVALMVYDTLLALGLTPSELMGTPTATPAASGAA